jgi:hypothetical protein
MRGEPYINRADEILVPHQNIGHSNPKDDSQDPSPNKTFNSLLGGEFDELCAPECDSAYIGKDIVAYHQGGRQEEPDHSFKDVVHDEMRLDHDQV